MKRETSRSLIRATALGLVLAAVVATDRRAEASSYTIVAGGAPVTVTTTASGETARATFSGTSGRSISLKISSVTMSSATVAILKPDGTNLVTASSFGTTGKWVDKKSLPVSGTYTIVIDPTNAVVGSATLTLYDVPADVTGSITPGGASLTLTTTVPGQNAKATFSGTSGQRVSLKVGPTCCSLTISIQKPDGTNLFTAASITASGGFIDTKTLPVAGTYTIVVNPTNSAVGAATLTLYDVPANPTASITPGGASLTLTTTVPGQNAKATFSGISGQRVSLKVGPTCCSLKVSIQKPDGTNLVNATSISTSGGFIDTKTLPVAGTYAIVVDPQAAAIGSVTLTLYDVPNDVLTSITPGGAPLTVTTTVAGQNAKATFNGVANRGIALGLDNVTIGTSLTASIKLSIKKPDGTDLLAATLFGRNGGFIDTKTLPVNGTYTIVVDPQGDATGSLRLTLYDVPPQATGTITVGGGPVSLTFTAPYQNGRVTFPGTAGQRVTLGVNFAPTACCTVNVSINKPDGTRLVAPVGVASGNATIGPTTLPVTGTYTIVVDPFQTATGTVTLTLAEVPGDVTASATLGGPAVTVTTTTAGQNARVTFTGAANDGVVVKVGPGNCCSVAVSVLKPDGTTLAGPLTFATIGGSLYTKLPVAGTYTVLIDYVATAVGSVTVQLIRDNAPPSAPTLSLSATTADGFGQGTTFFYRPAGTGSVNVTATTSDPGSGINGVLFPALSGGFTPTTTATDSSVPYVRTYSWSPGATLNSASNTVTVTDNVGNSSSATFAVVPDSTPPTTTDNTASIGNAWKNTNQAVILSPSDGTGSGVAATYHTTNGVDPTTASPTGTSFTLSADGSYTIKYFSVDNVSNTEAVQTGSTVIRIDKTAPTVTMTAPPANIKNGQALTATASDGGSGIASVSYYYCAGTSCTPTNLIGTSTTGPSYSITWSAMPVDGPYQLLARATDVAGNSTDSGKRNVTIDNTPPAAPSITGTPPNPSNNPAPSFTFTGEAGATFACSIDGGAFTACSSPKAFSGLGAGSHTFQVRQTDLAGNTGPNASYGWTIDLTAPPAPTITAKPPALSNSRSPSFSYTGEAGATFQCQLDGGGFGACPSPKSYNNVADGSHTFQVHQTDTAGNVGPNASYTWTIDATPPVAPTLMANPANPTNLTNASFSFTGEAGTTFECQLDGSAFAACTSPRSYTGLAEGPHTFNVRQTDTAGNTSANRTFTWTVDVTAPTAPSLTSTPNNPTNSTAPSFSFTGEAGATFQCQLDGGAFAACTSPRNYTGVGVGSHTFNVRQTDAAGNAGPNASFAWTIDLTAPAAPSITANPGNPTNSQSASFSFTGEAGTTFQCQLDGGGFSSCTSPKSYTGLAEGSHTFTVHQTDSAGNTSSNSSFTWAIDLTAPADPTITVKPPGLSNSASASFSFAGEAGATFECELDGIGFSTSLCTSPKAYSGLSDGSHTFGVRQTDQAGNTGSVASYTWFVDTTAPNTTIDTAPSDPSTADVDFFFSANETSTFECSLDGAAFSSCNSPLSYTGLATGPHTFDVRATDPAGNTETTPASYAWSVG
jgi:uncharacterized protein YhfF